MELNQQKIETILEEAESISLSYGLIDYKKSKKQVEIERLANTVVELSQFALNVLKFNPLQLLSSKSEPNKELSLAEYGCSHVYELSINSPSSNFLILRDQANEGELYDFYNNAIIIEITHGAMLTMIDWRSDQVESVRNKKIRNYLIRELADIDFIILPEGKPEMVSIKLKSEKINFNYGNLIIEKELFDDIEKYQNLFKEVDHIYKDHNNFNANFVFSDGRFVLSNKSGDDELDNYLQNQLDIWNDLIIRNPGMQNTVFEFIAKIKNTKDKVRMTTLMGKGEIILA